MTDGRKPFILLDDARPGGGARLYRDPVSVIAASRVEEGVASLDRLREAGRQGLHVAGYLSYDFGACLEPALLRQQEHDHAEAGKTAGTPLLWFGMFRGFEVVDARQFGDGRGAWISPPRPTIDHARYAEAFARIQAFIAAGDIYQANLTFMAECRVLGDPVALYARLRGVGGGGWGGLVFTGEEWLLSFSPELFFTLEERSLTARPMKGTAPRDSDPETLAGDPKQRAENLMIVDLLRNDLSRIAVPGSVRVPSLFAVETYPTIRQMTSTVTATLAPGQDAVDVIRAMFPCGSVTGAPKIRAMEIIDEVEETARGPYTGSIGRIDPDGNAAFNVAIRTLSIRDGQDRARMGLGSGIVADSEVNAEWAEALAKGAFVTAASARFDLVETLRFDAVEGLCDLERHLLRMKLSAVEFGFKFDRHALRNELQAATFRIRDDRRVRIRLSPTGAVAIEIRTMPSSPRIVDVKLVQRPVRQDDFRLRHKTTDRAFYDRARTEAGAFEVVMVDEDGFLTEGSFTNVFVRRPDGQLVTPPLSRGLLPGILRQRLIEEEGAVERDLRPADLERGFFIGNALRGLIAARLVAVGHEAAL